jgi:HEAT repeat protein
MIGFVVEKRSSTLAAAAFEAGPGVVWPRATPPELVSALLAAMNDENQKVRLEATYALGVVAHAPLAPDQAQILIKGLDHYDPAVRAASAQVIGRLKVTSAGDALLKAVNDSREDVRYAAMHALGAIHHVDAADALGQQFVFYGKGEGAWAALDALAHLGLASNAPLFKEHLADKDPYLRRAAAEGLGRAGDRSAVDTLQAGATTDDSAMVRLAMAFALQKLGQNYVSRIADAMTSQKLRAQAEDYLVEFGPSVTQPLLARLQDPDAGVREATADVLGFVGGDAAIPALQAAAKDKDADVADAAKRAIERIKAKA